MPFRLAVKLCAEGCSERAVYSADHNGCDGNGRQPCSYSQFQDLYTLEQVHSGSYTGRVCSMSTLGYSVEAKG